MKSNKPRIGTIIQARMSSTRFPEKVLADLCGQPMLGVLLQRIQASKLAGPIVVATSTDSRDDRIASFCADSGVDSFRGSLDDVLDRYYQAAKAYSFDIVVRITADCPLVDPTVIDTVIKKMLDNELDYLTTSAPPEGVTIPDGFDVEIFSFQALERAHKLATTAQDREHVTFYFWKNPHIFTTSRFDLSQNWSQYRVTVDRPEDLEVVRQVYKALSKGNPLFSMEEVVDFLKTNPSVVALNSAVIKNEGWITK
jgi:spore coat polysaccharide biosynthesis protein SpsF